jgi:nucleoid-associated protein YgaU
MGTFEKLGILVIVVIIVMILAVAISQWGGIAEPIENGATAGAAPELAVPLAVDLENLARREREAQRPADAVEPPDAPPVAPAGAETWPGGVPKVYEVRNGDKLWVVVVKRWSLKESFVQAVQTANPRVQFTRLRPGDRLTIPDPAAYLPGSPAARPESTRVYEVQLGDNLEHIARKHLGKGSRWREILVLNPHVDARKLRPGDVLAIPLK